MNQENVNRIMYQMTNRLLDTEEKKAFFMSRIKE